MVNLAMEREGKFFFSRVQKVVNLAIGPIGQVWGDNIGRFYRITTKLGGLVKRQHINCIAMCPTLPLFLEVMLTRVNNIRSYDREQEYATVIT